MPGRPPVPTALKILRGNPGRRPLNPTEPKPPIPEECPPCPPWLGRIARAFWEDQAPIHYRLGTLTSADLPAFTALAVTWQQWREKKNPNQLRCWMQLASGFGMTPAARTKIQANPPDATVDPITAFRRQRPTATR